MDRTKGLRTPERYLIFVYMLALICLGSLVGPAGSVYALQPPTINHPPLWVFQGRPDPFAAGWLWEDGVWSRIEEGEVFWKEDEVRAELAKRGWAAISIEEMETEMELDESGLTGGMLEAIGVPTIQRGWEIKARQGPWRATISVSKLDTDEGELFDISHPYGDVYAYYATLSHVPPLKADAKLPSGAKWKPVPGSSLVMVRLYDQTLVRGGAYGLKTPWSSRGIIDYYAKHGDWVFYPAFDSIVMGCGVEHGSVYYMYIEMIPSHDGETVYHVVETGDILRDEFLYEYERGFEHQETDW